jgi:hypothetical protein
MFDDVAFTQVLLPHGVAAETERKDRICVWLVDGIKPDSPLLPHDTRPEDRRIVENASANVDLTRCKINIISQT